MLQYEKVINYINVGLQLKYSVFSIFLEMDFIFIKVQRNRSF